jgi:hypothetical protein
VTALEKKVTALQKQATVTQAVVGGVMFWSVCSAVTTADALLGTWQTIDELSAATQAGKTYFSPQTRVDDTVVGKHACTVTRVGRSGRCSRASPHSTICFASSVRGTEQPE